MRQQQGHTHTNTSIHPTSADGALPTCFYGLRLCKRASRHSKRARRRFQDVEDNNGASGKTATFQEAYQGLGTLGPHWGTLWKGTFRGKPPKASPSPQRQGWKCASQIKRSGITSPMERWPALCLAGCSVLTHGWQNTHRHTCTTHVHAPPCTA